MPNISLEKDAHSAALHSHLSSCGLDKKVIDMTKKRKNAKSVAKNIPTEDYFQYKELNSHSDLESLVNNLIDNFEFGYFLQWEAVIRNEQGLTLSSKQQEALDGIIHFGDEDDEVEDDRILYIDEVARPNKPWYEIVKIVSSHLVVDKLKTDDAHYEVITEGWPRLVESLNEYGKDLTLPKGISSPLDVVPLDIQHRLWFQYCCDAFLGIGQQDVPCLSDKSSHFRFDMFMERLKECKESVDFLKLNLEKILSILILPSEDKEIFKRIMMDKLGINSVKEPIIDSLK